MTAIKLILPVAAMAALGGCVVTGGPTESRDYALSNFDSIRAEAGIDVVLRQGPFAVEAVAPEGRLDNIVVEQNGRELKLRRESEMLWFTVTGRHVVNVTAPTFVRIDAAGGADVEASGLQADVLTLEASGGADIVIERLTVTTLDAASSGGGDIELAGSCTTATLTASGGGDVNAERLACTNVTASASGGGDVDAAASAMANGSASGGGDVRFYGAPAQFTADESPGGSVKLEGR